MKRCKLDIIYVYVCVQVVTLFGVSGVSDVYTERSGEAGWLGPHLHHLYSQWYHWKPRLRTVSALQS